MLFLLNILFFVVHTALMLFNMTGWIFPRTRRLHQACLVATLFSWLVLGFWKGLGYCVCADWHFQVRRAMGIHDGVQTYLQLLARVFFGLEMDRTTSDILAVGGLGSTLVATIVVWSRGRRLPDGETLT
jgi:Protein of Unknown function (DUF2784)